MGGLMRAVSLLLGAALAYGGVGLGVDAAPSADQRDCCAGVIEDSWALPKAW